MVYNSSILAYFILTAASVFTFVLFYRNKTVLIYLIVGFVHLLVVICLLFGICKSKAYCFKLTKNLYELHDFLIEYKSTPRSKLLRKHLPQELSMVLEEESYLEQTEQTISSGT